MSPRIKAALKLPLPPELGVQRSILPFSISTLPKSPPISLPSNLRLSYDRPADPVNGSFNGHHPKSKLLAVNLDLDGIDHS